MGFAVLPQTIYAQWGFTLSQGQRGNCVGCGNIQITVIDFGTIPINGFPTRQACESARQSVSGISQSFYCGCTLYIQCSECRGTDIGMSGNNSNSGGINFDGIGHGEAYYLTNNLMQNLSNWIDEEQLRMYLQKFDELFNGNFIIAKTGNKNFDVSYASELDQYGSLLYDGLTPSMEANKDKGITVGSGNRSKGVEIDINQRVAVREDLYALPVKDGLSPISPNTDWNNNESRNTTNSFQLISDEKKQKLMDGYNNFKESAVGEYLASYGRTVMEETGINKMLDVKESLKELVDNKFFSEFVDDCSTIKKIFSVKNDAENVYQAYKNNDAGGAVLHTTQAVAARAGKGGSNIPSFEKIASNLTMNTAKNVMSDANIAAKESNVNKAYNTVSKRQDERNKNTSTDLKTRTANHAQNAMRNALKP